MGARASFLWKTSQKTCLQKSPTPFSIAISLGRTPCFLPLPLTASCCQQNLSSAEYVSFVAAKKIFCAFPGEKSSLKHAKTSHKKNSKKSKNRKKRKTSRSIFSTDENKFEAKKKYIHKNKKSPRHKKNILKPRKRKKKLKKNTAKRKKNQYLPGPIPAIGFMCVREAIDPYILSKCALSQPNGEVVIDFGCSPPLKVPDDHPFLAKFLSTQHSICSYCSRPKSWSYPFGSKIFSQKDQLFFHIYLRRLEKSKKPKKYSEWGKKTTKPRKNFQKNTPKINTNKKRKKRQAGTIGNRQSKNSLMPKKIQKKDQKIEENLINHKK